jgi:hypothetical protein
MLWGYIGKDTVREIWQNPANVPGLFAKTAMFPPKHLAEAVKTKLAPDPRQRTEGLTNRMEVRHG